MGDELFAACKRGRGDRERSDVRFRGCRRLAAASQLLVTAPRQGYRFPMGAELRHRLRRTPAERPPPPVLGAPSQPLLSKPTSRRRFWRAQLRHQDPYVIGAGLRGCSLQKCFVDHIDAYSVNEVAINWNAAMTWAAARLDEEGDK